MANHSRTSMPRAIIAATAALAGGLLAYGLGAQPALAAAEGIYRAELASPLAEPRREIVAGQLWRCDGAECGAKADGSRPVLVCKAVARTFGPVAHFATPRGDLPPDDLARCNTR
ncbi:MAG: hypothetical protein M0R03_05890 [Novosphingobium sp.]|nr:hypothetical protein [Novosphingobium sp.]